MDHDTQLKLKTGCLGFLRSMFRNPLPARKPAPLTLHRPTKDSTRVERQISFGDKDMDSPPSYSAAVVDEPVFAPDVLKTMEDKIDELGPALKHLSLQIHENPELMFKEKFAHDILTEFMSARGFTVKPHYLGLSTAWRASFKHGKGGPVIGVNSEMDALPGIGHACGHNLIAISGVGIALGIKAAIEKHNIAGEVVLLGTPAEEGGGGKVLLFEKGGYDDMDACIMCHPGPGPGLNFAIPPSLAIQIFDVEFFGHTAHASAAPWEGINALDAAVLAYSSISALRQQIQPTHRVHGIIEGRDWAPNVIPDYAKMSYIARAPTADEADVLVKRVTACFEAAALATGCKHKIAFGIPYSNLVQNSALKREFTKLATKRYKMVDEGAVQPFASTDFGNISHALPSLHPGYSIATEAVNHTLEFTKAAATPEAHRATLYTTKALAATGIRLLADAEFLKEVKDQFRTNAS